MTSSKLDKQSHQESQENIDSPFQDEAIFPEEETIHAENALESRRLVGYEDESPFLQAFVHEELQLEQPQWQDSEADYIGQDEAESLTDWDEAYAPEMADEHPEAFMDEADLYLAEQDEAENSADWDEAYVPEMEDENTEAFVDELVDEADLDDNVEGEQDYNFEFTDVTLDSEVNRNSREYIRWVQQSLNKVLGLSLKVDGIMGPMTRSAIRRFQQKQGLKVDGIVGPQTEKALRAKESMMNPPIIPSQPRVLTYSTKDVIDDRISVPAQHSLVRLSKKPDTNAVALGLLDAIKKHQLAGIYCVNWEKAGQRAIALGSNWWTVIPKGEDAVLMLDPDNLSNGPTLIAFRRELDPRKEKGCGGLKTDRALTPLPARIDTAIKRMWRVYTRFRNGEIVACSSHQISTKRSSGEPTVPMTCLSTFRKSIVVPCCNVVEEMEPAEVAQKKESSPSVATIQAKLSLYQFTRLTPPVGWKPNDILGFKNLADRQARRTNAVHSLNQSECPTSLVVGATPYETGLHIINALEFVYRCLREKVELVHIFGHSGQHGLMGDDTIPSHHYGLYINQVSLNGTDYAIGGRNIKHIPTQTLARNVIFVLHGCRTALTRHSSHRLGAGPSFAESLFIFLHGSGLTDVKVFGHANSYGIGVNMDWYEFSVKHPHGHSLPSLSPLYIQ